MLNVTSYPQFEYFSSLIFHMTSYPQVSTTSLSPATKPAFWVQGGIHAREWIAPATVIYIFGQVKLCCVYIL